MWRIFQARLLDYIEPQIPIDENDIVNVVFVVVSHTLLQYVVHYIGAFFLELVNCVAKLREYLYVTRPTLFELIICNCIFNFN